MQKYWGVIIAVMLIMSCKEKKEVAAEITIEENAPVVEKISKIYGFNLDDFTVEQDTVRNGDSFGELMLQNKVDYPKIAHVAENFKDTFDVRRIQVGKPYTILKPKDTTQAAQVFIYENDRINYTVVDFRDDVVAYKNQKAIKYVEREASGIIESNLSTALEEQGIDQMVSHNLSEIYAWTVDFFRLQKGDKFKVIYKEKYINDTVYAGADPIEAAYFEHNGEPFYAFGYEGDSLTIMKDFYDEKANNLRRTFLRAPVKFSRISSRYNLKRRIRYYGYRLRPHKGTDYAAPIGTEILATANGVVTESTRRGGNGKYVKIRHNGTYSTQYLHMKKQKVRKGDFVKQGEVIGWVGMTGNTGGPHVCYRFWKHGRQVDPLRQKLPAAEPLAEPLREDYFAFIAPLKTQLDCITYPEPITKEEQENLITMNH